MRKSKPRAVSVLFTPDRKQIVFHTCHAVCRLVCDPIADMNLDGMVTIDDATMIQKDIAERNDHLG